METINTKSVMSDEELIQSKQNISNDKIEILLKDFEEKLNSFKSRDELCNYLASKGIHIIDETTGIEYGKKTDLDKYQAAAEKYIENLTPEKAKESLIATGVLDENGMYPMIDPTDEKFRGFLRGFGVKEEDIDSWIEESNKKAEIFNNRIQNIRTK